MAQEVRSKYKITTPSTVEFNVNGIAYPDLFSFPVEEFVYIEKPLDYILTEKDVRRFDQLMLSYYASADFYDDIVLWLNDILYLDDDLIGTTIRLPSKRDLDNFYLRYLNEVSG